MIKTEFEYLKQYSTYADVIIQKYIFNNLFKLKDYHQKGVLGNNITVDLIRDYSDYAQKYIQYLMKSNSNLYSLIEWPMHQDLRIQYRVFPFWNLNDQCDILKEIERLAAKLVSKEECLKYQVTCLELLYFFTLLINENYNWVTVDFLSQCNKYHQYFIQ